MTDGPVPLALLRWATALSIMSLPWVYSAPDLAALPVAHLPLGAAWLAPLVDPTLARVASVGVISCAALGGLGVYPRIAFAGLTVLGVYLLAIPQLHGAVLHYHHLLWFSALLAASPCGDALTVTQWRPAPGRSLAWGVPVRLAWLIIAAIFFFPGLHKLLSQGPAWAGENLLLQMQWKWAESWAFQPLFRLDRWPRLLMAGGFAVLVLETLFPLAILWKPTRLVFVAGALVFHALTALFFDIHFGALWCCYVVFLPIPADAAAEEDAPIDWCPSAAVGSVLLAGIAATGFAGVTQGWPFACYPTFDQRVGDTMPTVMLVSIDTQGREREVPERALAEAHASQAFYGEVWAVAGHYGPVDDATRQAWFQRVARRSEVAAELVGAEQVVLYRATKSVDPDRPTRHRGEVLARFRP